MIIILQICYITFDLTLQALTFQLHRIVQSPWAPLLNRLLAKYVVLDDTELDLPLSMKSIVFISFPHCFVDILFRHCLELSLISALGHIVCQI
jgi:hypothetical protein